MRIITLAAATLTAAAAPALAVPFKAGNTIANLPNGTTAAADPSLKGNVVVDRLVPFQTPPGSAKLAPPVMGQLQTRTVRGSDGKLTFYWRVLNAATSKGTIKGLFLVGFTDAATSIDWRLDGVGTVAPATASRFYGNNAGWVLAFQFATPIKPGESSRFIFMKTGSTLSKPDKAVAYLTTSGSTVPEFKVEGLGN